jgi:ribosomal protein L37E
MNCPFCQRDFDEELAEKECRQCSLFSTCRKVECPYCGYQSPRKPKLLKWLKKIRIKND